MTIAARTNEAGARNSAKYWLRWIVALPAAVLAVIVVAFLIHWAVLILSSMSSSKDNGIPGLWDLPPRTLERMGDAFFSPMTFIYVAARVAPAFKLHTALVLMILWAMGIGTALTYGAMIGTYEGWAWGEFAAVGVLGVVGVLVGGYSVYNDHHA